jgi:hypothetical protein
LNWSRLTRAQTGLAIRTQTGICGSKAASAAATPDADQIKSGFEYCENGIVSSIQDYAPSVTEWVLKNADKLKGSLDFALDMRAHRPAKNLHHQPSATASP